MKWTIKAIENEEGQDLYVGDQINLGDKITVVETINIINGMLIINGQVIDLRKLEIDQVPSITNPQDYTAEINEETTEDTAQVGGDGQCNDNEVSHG